MLYIYIFQFFSNLNSNKIKKIPSSFCELAKLKIL